MRTFASDNNAPVAPEILEALLAANHGDAISYGDDEYTHRARAAFRRHFGEGADVYFVFNGTGANVVALASLLKPYEAVITPASAHLETDECGAFERFAGCKILGVATEDGKLRVADVAAAIGHSGDQHHVQVRAISISQSTEFGGVYTRDEVRDLSAFAREHGIFVHCDGARIANAAAALGVEPREITADAGVDVLTFGGTKNGLMFGEAILFFDPALHAGAAPFVRKQAAQLASKMRYIAVQFEALLAEDRWRRYAAHANAMAKLLEERARRIPGVRITRPVACNAVFATLDRTAIERIQREFFFHVFDEALPEVRWMTSFDTTPEDVTRFADAIARGCAAGGDR